LSLFDLIAGALIAVSALAGYRRGAVREVIGFFAFGLAVYVTLSLLPMTSAFAAVFFHPHWVAVASAVVAGFALVYLCVLILSRWVTWGLSQRPVLGGLNQALGLGVGGFRAIFLLGLFALLFDRATPDPLKPEWVTGAFFYPLASESGQLIGRLAPAGLRAIGRPSALLNGEHGPDRTHPDRLADQPGASATTPPRSTRKRHHGVGYDQNSRTQIDDLVERTR
jgi:membrane protein required for colicin V production